MEPIAWPEPFDDGEWQFEVKWDGVRCRAECDGQEVRLFSRSGTDWSGKFPEITRVLSGYRGVFDGEICALRNGRPDFPLMLRRLGRMSGPVHYVVFDCIENAVGADMRQETVETRQQAIPEFPRGAVRRIESVVATGRSLFAAVEASGLEGVVAKRLGSRYLSGKSGEWRKVKCWRTLIATAGRAVVRAGEVRSLEILGDAGQEIGSVGPLTEALSRELLTRLRTGRPVRCRIRFLEWLDSGRIRQPLFLGFSDD